MSVEIKFDANQQYQLDAINSVVDLFIGQEALSQGFTTTTALDRGGPDALFDEVVFGNSLDLAGSTLEANLRRVQDRAISQIDGTQRPLIDEELRTDLTTEADGLDFSIEMETGTGKTYIYVRTIAELNKKYGYTKFIVVVPSVAIREGVLSSLRLLKAHIRELYDGLQFDSYVWDSRFPTQVRQFATASHLQIMVMNIDSFTKETNIMNKADPDLLNGYAPIEYLSACNPIVIMDEPQSMETQIRRDAIRSLSPLFCLRYSATHKDLKHLVYRLTPVDAYDLRIVKRIGVLSITKDEDFNEAFVEVVKIHSTRGGITASARIHKTGKLGTKPTVLTLRKDNDLFPMSGGRTAYQGWSVEDIHAGVDGNRGFVEFSNGRKVYEGLAAGTHTEQHQRLMIRQAIESHFEKELQLKLRRRRDIIPARIKPLTLFFIDKVANYYPADGKFREWFEQEYEFVRSDPRFRALEMPEVADVHDGYFAMDRGVAKDSKVDRHGKTRDTKETAAAFERIMRNKEKLLSFEEPLRFIFSHSALVEGWDNPNVFTICNLQEGKAEMRKRQQVGRGLRLPVMENGERCHVDDINMVTVIAYEEFSKFAADLQQEIEDETGVGFAGRISDLKKDKLKLKLKEAVLKSDLFQELWERISRKTTYQLVFEANDVVAEAVKRINAIEKLEPIRFRRSLTQVDINAEGVGAGLTRDRGTVDARGARKLPDVVGELSRRVPLTRATVVRILTQIDNLDQVKVNPSVFIDKVEAAINAALYNEVADGIVYTPSGDERWSAELFRTAHQDETVVKPEFVVPVSKSVTDFVVCDSKVEVAFANFLEKRRDVPLFLKLPGWFKIDTPLGNYNPDWAIVREESAGQTLYLVRETKGTDVIENLQWETEGWKIQFGKAHFSALKVDYAFSNDPDVLISPSSEPQQTSSELQKKRRKKKRRKKK